MLQQPFGGCTIIIPPFYPWGHCITLRVCDLSKALLVINSRARILHRHHCARTHSHKGLPHPSPWPWLPSALPAHLLETSGPFLYPSPFSRSLRAPPVFTLLSAQMFAFVQTTSPALGSPSPAPTSADNPASRIWNEKKTLFERGAALEPSGRSAKVIFWRKLPLCSEKLLQEPLGETQGTGGARVGKQEQSGEFTFRSHAPLGAPSHPGRSSAG